ncbi:hypothetical protein NL108_007202 [Boleophthalmus pectinirostris]|nr:hypothetical protein NL108_007202 [Boleophthalmus pectinirostris]
MERTVLLFLSLLWVMGVIGQQKIIYVTQALTWSDAQVYCRQHYIDLVTVRTTGDNDQLYEDTWLGMYRDNSSSPWKWSRGDEPNTFNNEWKTGKYPLDTLRGAQCSRRLSFYCLDNSLFLVTYMKTWEAALVHCRSLSSGDLSYDLATVLTMEDHDFVWTGLRFLGDRWVWVGGEEVQYENITTCPENKRCGMVDKMTDKLYNIADCKESRNFFCYKKSPLV